MNRYPNDCIDADSYRADHDDGSELVRAENGQAWVYRKYDEVQSTFEITHRAQTKAEEAALRAFYAANKGGSVLFKDPRTGEDKKVLILRPPELVGMDSPTKSVLRMTLVAVNG